VFAGEPPPTGGDLYFSVFRIPVRVHPFFWLVMAILGLPRGDDLRLAIVHLLTWLLAAFLVILIHELGHALVMRAYGFAPSIVLYGLGGYTSYNPTGSYRSAGYSTLGQVLISFAGPAAGFLLAAVILAILIATGHRVGLVDIGLPVPLPIWIEEFEPVAISDLIQNIVMISIFWGLLNLLPVYPLDGGHITRDVLVRINPRDGIRQSLLLSLLVAAAMAVVGMTVWQSLFATVLFGLLAFQSYQALQAYSGR